VCLWISGRVSVSGFRSHSSRAPADRAARGCPRCCTPFVGDERDVEVFRNSSQVCTRRSHFHLRRVVNFSTGQGSDRCDSGTDGPTRVGLPRPSPFIGRASPTLQKRDGSILNLFHSSLVNSGSPSDNDSSILSKKIPQADSLPIACRQSSSTCARFSTTSA
jgi:hypothetical protein